MNVYILPALFTPEECRAVRDLFPPAQEGVINVGSGGTVKRAERKSEVAFLPTETPEQRMLLQRLRDVVAHANRKVFHFDLQGDERPQLARYGVGGKYDWHLDIGPGSAGLRKLSVSVQLSAPEEYEGGDLELWGSPAADRSQGAITIFPSYLLHRVAEVTRGERFSLVIWATGINSYR